MAATFFMVKRAKTITQQNALLGQNKINNVKLSTALHEYVTKNPLLTKQMHLLPSSTILCHTSIHPTRNSQQSSVKEIPAILCYVKT